MANVSEQTGRRDKRRIHVLVASSQEIYEAYWLGLVLVERYSVITPASTVGRYTIVTSKSKAKKASFSRRIVSIHRDTAKSMINAKTQSLVSSPGFGSAANLQFSFFTFAF